MPTFQRSMITERKVVVTVDAKEIFGSPTVALAYPAYVGTIDGDGKIDVWTPAGSVPRNYKRAAESMLRVLAQRYTTDECPEPFTLAMFMLDNAEAPPDDATLRVIEGLGVGESTSFDEGAGGVWTIQRIK